MDLFHLLNPIALLAATAVIVPVLVHLWNTRRGKTLKVGSITLLSKSSQKPARSLQITNWPLLLLRCLLLMMIALLMAKPYWQTDLSGKKGWIMVPDHELAYAYRHHQGLIDSLTRQGFELHDLTSYRKILALQDTALYQFRPQPFNTWSHLKYLDAVLPANFPVYIFSDQLAQNFAGKRPSVQLDYHWIGLNDPDRADTTAVAVYTDREGKLNTIGRISNATGNHYENIATAADPSITPDTTAVVYVALYPGNNFSDAKYVRAAVEAIAAYTGRNIVINENAAGPQQVIFWLQDDEPDEKVIASLAPGGTIFRYADPASSAVQPALPANNGSFISNERSRDLFFRYATGPSEGKVLWTLANGEPLMVAQTAGNATTIYFRSRFNPQWTDMVWKESFARLLVPVILPSFKEVDTDLRQISSGQAQPKRVQLKVNGNAGGPGFLQRMDLSFAGWLIAFLLFAAERTLTYRQTKQKNA